MSLSNERPAKRGFRAVLRAPFPIIAKSLRCLHQNPFKVFIFTKASSGTPQGAGIDSDRNG